MCMGMHVLERVCIYYNTESVHMIFSMPVPHVSAIHVY